MNNYFILPDSVIFWNWPNSIQQLLFSFLGSFWLLDVYVIHNQDEIVYSVIRWCCTWSEGIFVYTDMIGCLSKPLLNTFCHIQLQSPFIEHVTIRGLKKINANAWTLLKYYCHHRFLCRWILVGKNLITNTKNKHSWGKVGNIVKFNANLDKSQFLEQSKTSFIATTNLCFILFNSQMVCTCK